MCQDLQGLSAVVLVLLLVGGQPLESALADWTWLILLLLLLLLHVL